VKKITKACIDKKLGLPTVFIKLHGAGFGFNFLIDTSVRHNLIDPCFFKDWIEIKPPKTEKEIALLGEFAQYLPVTASYLDKGKKRIICKDGVKRVCDMIKLDFTIDTRKYSEPFAIDESMCQYFNFKKNKAIVGVLGNDFLKKYKWVVDYSKM